MEIGRVPDSLMKGGLTKILLRILLDHTLRSKWFRANYNYWPYFLNASTPLAVSLLTDNVVISFELLGSSVQICTK